MSHTPLSTNPNTSLTTVFDTAAVNAGDFNKDIVLYKNATPEQREIMDALIERLDLDDLMSITAFDQEAAQTLNQSTENISAAVERSTTFGGGLQNLRDKIPTMDLSKLGKEAQTYVKKLDKKTSMFLLKLMQIFGRKGTPDARFFEHEVSKNVLVMQDIIATLRESHDKIPELANNLRTLGLARIQAYSDYSIVIGAALEKYEREKISFNALAANTDLSPLEQQKMKQRSTALTILNSKITSMYTFHQGCIGQLSIINDLGGCLAQSQLKIDDHLKISVEQWKALLNEARVAVGVAKVASDVTVADKFGDKLHDQVDAIAQMTKNLVKESMGHGTIAPDKVINHLQKIAEATKKELDELQNFNQKMEKKRLELDVAGKQCLEALDQSMKTIAALSVPANQNDGMGTQNQITPKSSLDQLKK